MRPIANESQNVSSQNVREQRNFLATPLMIHGEDEDLLAVSPLLT
jgi:hypothetical protein